VTQIISVITHDYALLASDRRLTIAEGPHAGKVGDDDSCKLVNLCNICGIGYTGLAHLERDSTHEWIAKALASEACHDSLVASRCIALRAAKAFSTIRPLVQQTFVLAGWGLFKGLSGLHAHMRLVSNAYSDSGQVLSTPNDSFANLLKVLTDSEELFWRVVGYPLLQKRGQQLNRNLRRLVNRGIGPKETLRLLMEEIVNTSKTTNFVGTKVLGFCIPKRGVESLIQSGRSVMLAKLPDEDIATFAYFNSGYSELRQYGPTFICGEYAVTDIKTENDPARDFQSAQIRLLSFPKPRP
jgi:hypothetical protein